MLGLVSVKHLHVILPGEDQGREVSASWGLALSQVGMDLVLESVDGYLLREAREELGLGGGLGTRVEFGAI